MAERRYNPKLLRHTTEANSLVAPIHHRMPVALEEEDWPVWLGEQPISWRSFTRRRWACCNVSPSEGRQGRRAVRPGRLRRLRLDYEGRKAPLLAAGALFSAAPFKESSRARADLR